jgi:hypothetical protein
MIRMVINGIFVLVITVTENITVANMNFASGGVTCKLGALYFYSASVQLTVLCSETRSNAKPENVGSKARNRRKLRKFWKILNKANSYLNFLLKS